jgi:DNA repair exonuclease SbcCD ATPase subunit
MLNFENKQNIQDLRPTRHFIKHLFLASKVYTHRVKAVQDVGVQLQRMRKSIIRMSLTYSEIDSLKKKLENLIDYERQFARFFKPDDKETRQMKEKIRVLAEELQEAREERQKIINENEEKIKELTESLNQMKKKLSHLFIENAHRQQRMRALDMRISHKVDSRSFYDS